jgi:mRNA interferase MazF
LNKYEQYGLWLADLNPRFGTEVRKVQPVLIVQTDLLNNIGHPSTLICPLTTKIFADAFPLRVFVPTLDNKLQKASDIMVDQMSSVDNQRFTEYLGKLDSDTIKLFQTALKQVLAIP